MGGKKSSPSKHRDINVYQLFGAKKYVCTCTGVQTRDSNLWRDLNFGGTKSSPSKHGDIDGDRLFDVEK